MVNLITVNDRLDEIYTEGPSIFLAGPCPRDDSEDWRDEAIKYFEELDKDVNIFNPTNPDYNKLGSDAYNIQCNWEWEHMKKANVIMFWVPRDLDKNPALTTNVEFGYWMGVDPSKVVYGRPDDAPKNRYLDALYNHSNEGKIYSTLKETVYESIIKGEEI